MYLQDLTHRSSPRFPYYKKSMSRQDLLAFQGDITLMYQVARGLIAQNPSLLWKYDEWAAIRRSLLSFGNATLHTLAIDIASEQLIRTLSTPIHQGETKRHLSKLSQTEFDGLCSHVYYEIRKRYMEYKSASNETGSEVSVPIYFAFHNAKRPGSFSTSASTLSETTNLSSPRIRTTPLPIQSQQSTRRILDISGRFSTSGSILSESTNLPSPPPRSKLTHPNQPHLSTPSILDISSTIYRITKDTEKYRTLLRLRGNDAQVILDFIQMALDYEGLHAKIQKRLLITALRLSRKASLYPKCFTLDEIKVEESAVTAGHFGEIWKGQFRGQAVCLKVVKVYQRSHMEDLLKAFSKEGILWGHLCHENVLPFYGIYHLADAYGRICLTSPWMEQGNVNEYLKRNPNASRILLVLDVIEGVSYLHSNGVIHGDLKGANILISSSDRACLADFGLSSVIDSEILRWTSLESSTNIGGTVRWTGPELMDPENDNARPTTASDIYAFSCVCYEIFTGNNPFHEVTRDPAVMLKVMKGERPTLPARNRPPRRKWGLTPRVWELMEQCWQQEASKRPTANSVIESIYMLIRETVANGGTELIGITQRKPQSLDTITPSKFRNAVHQSVDLNNVDKILRGLFNPSAQL